jgi:2-desacetyl-2-hydroxyethyl bacteriochlorophyllide A dehydrogenase
MDSAERRADLMKALLYHGPRDIRYGDFADPSIVEPTDAIVRVERSGICGSDLHIYHGQGFSPDTGFCVGHESVGAVVARGSAVRRLNDGQSVMLSAAVGCGSCAKCLAGHIARCERGVAGCYGLSHQLQGCQAEYVRVPMADFNSAPIPDGLTPDQALMLTDNLPTAYYGCRNAEVGPGKSVAVVGLGPIGLMAVEIAFVLGASRVFAVDLVPERRALAEQLGAEALDGANAIAEIAQRTNMRMVDSVVEASGSDATVSMAIMLAGSGGTASVVGVNLSPAFQFPMALAFVKGLTFRIGTCSVQCHWPELISLIQPGRLRPERFISHHLPLSRGAEAYALFDARAHGALKMVLTA